MTRLAATELPAAFLGTRLPLTNFRHAAARFVRIRFADPQPFTVDGDLFPPTSDLRIDAGPALRFLTSEAAAP